jgi:hypothetical protein
MSVSFYSEALRTIGRDLDLRGIRTFVIRCETDLFVVEAGYQSPPAITPVTLHYTLCDVERLDREAQERSVHLSPVKDLLSLAEILWAVAAYVSSKQGRLLSVSNTASTPTMPILTIEYETVQKDRVIEDLKGSAIYELSISIYKRRDIPSKTRRYTLFSDLNTSDLARD